jgi:hypothetical protein
VNGVRSFDRDLTAYNLTIHGIHTYHAGITSVLVHNCAVPSDYRGLSEKYVEGIVTRKGYDSIHAFKEEYVGRTNISRFDVKKGPGGEPTLVSKDGKTRVRTNHYVDD